MYTRTHARIALEHIRKCHNEKDRREQQIEGLKSRIEELNSAIAVCQEKLPASGAPITRQVSSCTYVQAVGYYTCVLYRDLRRIDSDLLLTFRREHYRITSLGLYPGIM